jgi:NADPH-dependent curcumin reductase CurA
MTTMARQIVLAARPHGKPKLTDFRLEQTAIPTPNSGQLLLGVQYLSLDPYMRGRMDDRKSYAKPLQLGDVMTGETVARVIASNRPDYSEGDMKEISSWRQSDGALTRYPRAPAFASSIPPLHRSRPASACSACQGSRLMAVCG